MILRKASEPIHRTNSDGSQWRTKEYFVELHKGYGFLYIVEFGNWHGYIRSQKFWCLDDAEQYFEELMRKYDMSEDGVKKELIREVVVFT